MARGVNKVILIGNLGADPETRSSASGMSMASIRLATTENFKNSQTGEREDRTEWHRVKFFGKLAEIAGQYLRKGRQVYIEGSIRTSKFTGKDGQEHYMTEIIANNMQMLGGRDDAGGGEGGGGYSHRPPARPAAPPSAGEPEAAAAPDAGFGGDEADDIPF